MLRRTFTTELLGVLLAASLGARAAKQPRRAHIGVLSPSRTTPEAEALVEALRQTGYVDGQSALIEWQTSEGDRESFARLAAELVLHKVDMIVTLGSEATEGAKLATRTVPIVFDAGDAVGAGFVDSLARPGGNLTGRSQQLDELAAKHMQLLRDILPETTDLVVLWDPANASMARFVRQANAAAPQFHFRIQPIAVPDADSLEASLAAVAQARPRAMIVLVTHERRISEFALNHRIVTLGAAKRMVKQGMLISYASNLAEGMRQVADYVDRILKGADPARLPVQQPTKFELVVNMRTAKALGISLPQSLLSRADEVIQ